MNDTSSTQMSATRITVVSLIHSNWKWLAFRGALALLFGVIALFSPLSAVYALTFVFGAYALIDGIASVVMGVRHAREKAEQWWSLILRGVLGILPESLWSWFRGQRRWRWLSLTGSCSRCGRLPPACSNSLRGAACARKWAVAAVS
jgi:hypothetical protein